MKRSIGYVLAVLVLILLALYPPVNGAEAADEPRFTGVSFEVLTLYENYFEGRVSLRATSMPITFPFGNLSIGWTLTSNEGLVTVGTLPAGHIGGLHSPNPFPITSTINPSGLSSGTLYVLSVTAGLPGNMVTGTFPITTLSYPDESLHHARIDSNNIVIDRCVCSGSSVRANPSEYPGTWVPLRNGLGGWEMSQPIIGWRYDPLTRNFYEPETPTEAPSRGRYYDNYWGYSNFWPASTPQVGSTEAPSSGGSNPVTTQPRPISTTTSVEAVEDDGQSEDDFADIGVSLRSGKFDMRISSSFPETEMMLRAFKKGSKSIIWNMTTNADGNYRILTNRALKGFTLSLWIDGDKWDSLTVR